MEEPDLHKDVAAAGHCEDVDLMLEDLGADHLWECHHQKEAHFGVQLHKAVPQGVGLL